MKTTIELPDDLLIEAKKRAAELRLPLRHLIEQGLRHQIASRQERKRKRIRWITAKGGLPEGVDLSDRCSMYDWLSQSR